jgi:predicted lipoprotein with Yx(FWY)xxD motif
MGTRVGAAAAAVAAAAAFAVGATGSTGVKATISVASNGTLGKIVVGSTGHTLYHFTGDHGKHVACTGVCAATWPPLLVGKTAKPLGGAGITGAKLGTIARPDGSLQVTYNGLTLYTYSGDAKRGQANGEGLENKWFAVGSTGALVKAAPAASSSGAAPGGYGNSSTASTPTTTTGSDGGGYYG